MKPLAAAVVIVALFGAALYATGHHHLDELGPHLTISGSL